MTDAERFEALRAELLRYRVCGSLASRDGSQALFHFRDAIVETLRQYLPLRIRRTPPHRFGHKAGRGTARLTPTGLVHYSTRRVAGWIFATDLLDGRILPDD